MKVKLLITGMILSVVTPMAQANADCGAGYGSAVEINATTKVVTYSCVKLPDPTPRQPEPIAPTHTVSIQTTNQSVGFSGSLEAVTEQLAKIVSKPQAPLADPCVLGTCTKVEVNATTGVTTVSPLSLSDLAQRYKDAQFQYQRDVELAQAAQTAVIAPIEIKATEPEVIAEATEIKTVKAKKTKAKAKKRASVK